MSDPYNQLYIHIVWTTWQRMPLLDEQTVAFIYPVITEMCRDLKCEALAFGGIEDHVHLLVRLHPAVSISKLVKQVKGASSHLISAKIKPGEFFKWRSGYGAFSLRKTEVKKVIAYIEDQKAHHRKGDTWSDFEKVSEDEG